MKPSRWMWRMGALFYTASLFIFANPSLAAVAAVSIGDVTFGWGHVLVLIACGMVWGDSRTNRIRDREDQKRDRDQQAKDREEWRAEVREMRAEIKELWSERL